ncbi:unnamed protein product [Microthlaspi erraticum]|uniref:Uncharacterized protein n=1 Tax=Microthlaspi erraticum TaxID=1685480 RepID=A0A6D2L7N8_9BRAS|nr:unnamed protein product [Microthlaspi erraticum]
MDFIKTSSLRALIELTFQRNWNGLIWMSRKGVTTKRVKTVQTALSRESAPKPRSPAGRETCSALGQITSVRLKSRPKSKPIGRSRTRPGKHCPAVGQAKRSTPRRARPKRASRETSLAAAQPFRVPRPMHPSEPGRTSHVRPRILIGQISSVDHAGRPESVRPRPFRLAHDPMSGRSSRPTVPTPRSTRSPFEAQTYVFKPGLTLSRL